MMKFGLFCYVTTTEHLCLVCPNAIYVYVIHIYIYIYPHTYDIWKFKETVQNKHSLFTHPQVVQICINFFV